MQLKKNHGFKEVLTSLVLVNNLGNLCCYFKQAKVQVEASKEENILAVKILSNMQYKKFPLQTLFISCRLQNALQVFHRCTENRKAINH